MADLTVQVVYALPSGAVTCDLILAEGTNVQEALEMAAGLAQFATLGLAGAPAAVFGRRALPTQVLRPGDRIEILRPLAQDPKEARRRRVSRSGGS